jgi:hypothetical protein
MTAQDWLWGMPNEDPGTQDFGPGLSRAAIKEWEGRYGVPLPPLLKHAYQQQNGGMIRSQRIFLFKLEDVEPVGDAYFESIGGEPPADFETELTFVFGYDDLWEATLFLAYRTADDEQPTFYGYYDDGGSVAWTTDVEHILHEDTGS